MVFGNRADVLRDQTHAMKPRAARGSKIRELGDLYCDRHRAQRVAREAMPYGARNRYSQLPGYGSPEHDRHKAGTEEPLLHRVLFTDLDGDGANLRLCALPIDRHSTDHGESGVRTRVDHGLEPMHRAWLRVRAYFGYCRSMSGRAVTIGAVTISSSSK